MEGSESKVACEGIGIEEKQQVSVVDQQQQIQEEVQTHISANNQEESIGSNAQLINGSDMNNHQNHQATDNQQINTHSNMNQNGVNGVNGGAGEGPPPRLCHLVKWPHFDGYGFNLHAEKSKPGQYIGKVDENSPALHAGLREGDKIIEVNGVNISNENHKQVVERIKAISNETKLLVVDEATDRWYKDRKMVPKSTQPNVIYIRTPPIDPSLSNADQSTTISTPMNGSVNNKTQDAVMNGSKLISNTYDESKDTSSIKRQSSSIEDNDLTEATQALKIENRDSQDGQTMIMQKSASESESSPAVTSPSPTEGQAPQPGSPTSSHRSESSNGTAGSHNGSHMNMGSVDRSSSLGSDEFLNLNMTASQMRALLAQRKKRDPKKEQIDLRQKHQIIEQM